MSKQLTKAARREYKQDLSKVHANKMKAFFAGKDAYVTVPNPNTKANTPKQFL